MNFKIIRIISIVLLLAVMTAVFCFSAEPADESQQTSDGFLYRIVSIFYPDFKTMTAEQKNEIIEKYSAPIRKLAHFSIYGLMGVFSLLSFISYRAPKLLPGGIAAWILCVVYSVSDEIHQHFIPGRSCELRDMCIDSAGAILGILFAFIILSAIMKKRFDKIEK